MIAIIVITIVIIIALILFWLSCRFEQRKKFKARNACQVILAILGVCAFVITEKTCETIFHYNQATEDYSEHALDYNNLTSWSISYYLAQYFIKDKRHFPLLDPELIKEVKRAEHDRELTII